MPPTILVVEDDPIHRELMCELLEEHGYTCIRAEDGRRALDVLSADAPPDAVVLDVVLPGLNGHELLQELEARGQRAKVVVVSGFGPVSRFADRLPQVKAVVQKPVDLHALLSAVQSCLEEKEPAPASG